MARIFLKLPAERLCPGASFVHTITGKRPCTILSTQQRITYVQEEDEETHEIADPDQEVYLLYDQHLRRRLDRFREQLSTKEAEAFQLLRQIRGRTFVGFSILVSLLDPSRPKFQKLLSELRTQAEQAPEQLEAVVGTKLTRLLKELAA